jgi:hypothetical protein
MDKEELKKKAAAFGKKALEVGKVVGKFSLEAGREIAQEAVIVGQSLAKDLDKTAKNFEENSVNNKRWDSLQGVWHSKKIFPQAFEDVQTQLMLPLGAFKIHVHADPTISRITADSNWNEDIPGFPNSPHSVFLQLDFKPDGSGTVVNYLWTVIDFPKGLHTKQIIRALNSWCEMVLEKDTSEPAPLERG